ncbi:MAG TPA: WD40 repeat domain-containing protein [Gemmataceae bacterium]|nr:WD40 repeat domain-containing protein [Gemmataceae bacterium]
MDGRITAAVRCNRRSRLCPRTLSGASATGAQEPQRLEFVLQTGHRRGITSVALSGDGKYVLTASGDNTAILWEAASGKKLHTFQHTSGVDSVALSGDGKRILTSSSGVPALWEAATGKKLQTIPVRSISFNVALSRDGKYVVASVYDTNAILWEAATGKKIHTFPGHTLGVTSVALSGDGKLLVTGSRDKTAILWEAASGKRLQTFQGHTHWVTSVALSGDARHLWTTSEDGTIWLWDVATGKERCRLYSFDTGKDWLVVTPEGFFDGSPGAWRFVAYRVPGTLKLLDDGATRKRFHRPGLLAQAWKGQE